MVKLISLGESGSCLWRPHLPSFPRRVLVWSSRSRHRAELKHGVENPLAGSSCSPNFTAVQRPFMFSLKTA